MFENITFETFVNNSARQAQAYSQAAMETVTNFIWGTETSQQWLARTLASKNESFDQANQNSQQISATLSSIANQTPQDLKGRTFFAKNDSAEIAKYSSITHAQLNTLIFSSTPGNFDGGLIGQNLAYYNDLLNYIDKKIIEEVERDPTYSMHDIVNEKDPAKRQEMLDQRLSEHEKGNKNEDALREARDYVKKQIADLSKLQYTLTDIWMRKSDKDSMVNQKEKIKAIKENANHSPSGERVLIHAAVRRFENRPAVSTAITKNNRAELAESASDNDDLIKQIIEPLEAKKKDDIHEEIARDLNLVDVPDKFTEKYKKALADFSSETKQVRGGALQSETVSQVRQKLANLNESEQGLLYEAKILTETIRKYKAVQASRYFFGLSDPDIFDYININYEDLKTLVVSSSNDENIDGGVIAQNLTFYTHLLEHLKIERLGTSSTTEIDAEIKQAEEKIKSLSKLQRIFCAVLMYHVDVEENKSDKESKAKIAQAAFKIHTDVAQKQSKSFSREIFLNAVNEFNKIIQGGIKGRIAALKNDNKAVRNYDELEKELSIENYSRNANLIINNLEYRCKPAIDSQSIPSIADLLSETLKLEKTLEAKKVSVTQKLVSDKSSSEINNYNAMLDEKIIEIKKIRKNLVDEAYKCAVINNDIAGINYLTADQYKSILDAMPKATKEEKERYKGFVQNTGIAYQIIKKLDFEVLDITGDLKIINKGNIDQWFLQMSHQANDEQKIALNELRKIIEGDEVTLAKYTAENKENLSELAMSLASLFPDQANDKHVKKNQGAALLECVLCKFVVPTISPADKRYNGLINYVQRRPKASTQVNESYATTKKNIGVPYDINQLNASAEPSIIFLTEVFRSNTDAQLDYQIEKAWSNIFTSGVFTEEITDSIGYQINRYADIYTQGDGDSHVDSNKLVIIIQYQEFIKKRWEFPEPYAKYENGTLLSLRRIAEKRFNYFKEQIINGLGSSTNIYDSDDILFSKVKFSIEIISGEYSTSKPEILASLSDLALMACDNETISRVLSEKMNAYLMTGLDQYALTEKEISFIVQNNIQLYLIQENQEFYYGKGVRDNKVDEGVSLLVFQSNNEGLKKIHVASLINHADDIDFSATIINQCLIHSKAQCEQYLTNSIAQLEKGYIPSRNFMSLMMLTDNSEILMNFIIECMKTNNSDLLLNNQFSPLCQINKPFSEKIKDLIIENRSIIFEAVYQQPELIATLSIHFPDLRMELMNHLLYRIMNFGIQDAQASKINEYIVLFSSSDARSLNRWVIGIINHLDKISASPNFRLLIDRFPIAFYEKLYDILSKKLPKADPNLVRLKAHIDKVKSIQENSNLVIFNQLFKGGNVDGAVTNYVSLLDKINDRKKLNAPAENNEAKMQAASLTNDRVNIEKSIAEKFYAMNIDDRKKLLKILKAENYNLDKSNELYQDKLRSYENGSGSDKEVNDIMVREKIWRSNHLNDFINSLESSVNAASPDAFSIGLAAYDYKSKNQFGELNKILTFENMKSAIYGLSTEDKMSLIKSLELAIQAMNSDNNLTPEQYQQKSKLIVFYHMLAHNINYTPDKNIAMSQEELAWMTKALRLEEILIKYADSSIELDAEAADSLKDEYEALMNSNTGAPMSKHPKLIAQMKVAYKDFYATRFERKISFKSSMIPSFHSTYDTHSYNTIHVIVDARFKNYITTEELQAAGVSMVLTENLTEHLLNAGKFSIEELYASSIDQERTGGKIIDLESAYEKLGLDAKSTDENVIALRKEMKNLYDKDPTLLGKVISTAKVRSAAAFFGKEPLTPEKLDMMIIVVKAENKNRPPQNFYSITSTFQDNAAIVANKLTELKQASPINSPPESPSLTAASSETSANTAEMGSGTPSAVSPIRLK